jgi:hypothetical protein
MDIRKFINEGRYDSIVGKTTKKIMSHLKEKETEFEFTIVPIKDRPITTKIVVHWNDEEEIGVQGWMDLNQDILTLEIWMDSRYMKTNFNFLSGQIQDAVMHEIQHIAQHSYKERESEGLYGDQGYEGLEYYTAPFEVDAWVRGLYKQAKYFKKPLIKVFKMMIQHLDLEEDDKPVLLKTWVDYAKKNLPNAQLTENMIRNIIKEEVGRRYQGCSHFSDPNANQLCRKISGLRAWLHRDLGMRGVIDEMLKDIKVVQNMTEKYQEPLRILHGTGKYPEIKLVNGTYTHKRLVDAGLVLNDEGEYDYVNKLNTNYSDLAELITELLVKGGKVDALADKNEIGIKKYLENIKPVLLRLVQKYFKPEDLKQFVRNTVGLTQMGDEAEDYAGEVLEKYGMNQLYQGGNGDFIDMMFGADLIMNSEGRTITCQVKSSERQAVNASKSGQYKKIDYFISPQNGLGSGIVIYNREGKSFRMDDSGKIES